MRLEDLEAMNIPHLARIEIETNCHVVLETSRELGYFRKLETEECMDGEGECHTLTYYHSSSGPHQIPEGYYSSDIKDISSVNILVPKE